MSSLGDPHIHWTVLLHEESFGIIICLVILNFGMDNTGRKK